MHQEFIYFYEFVFFSSCSCLVLSLYLCMNDILSGWI